MKTKLLLLAAALFTINAFAQVPNYIPTNGLVGYWPFDNNADDASGNGHDATSTNATLTTDRFANANSAYSFNGTSNYIDVPDATALRLNNSDYTISFWTYINAYSTGGGTAFVYKRGSGAQNGWCVGSAPALQNKMMLATSGNIDPRGYSISTLALSGWHHVTIVYTLSLQELKFYIDGVLDNTTTGVDNNNIPVGGMPTPNANCTSAMRFGQDTQNNNYWLNGKLDDIGIWNTALTQDEIDGVFSGSCTTADITTGLVASYPFTGNANDVSGNNLNGTNNGATLTTDRFGNANSAYSFNGTSSYISVADNNLLDFTNQYSISGWLYATATSGNSNSRTIISKARNTTQTGLTLTLDNLQSYKIASDNTDASGPHLIFSSTIPTLDTWYHAVVTYDGTTLKIYVNGVLANSIAYTINLVNSTHELDFGSQRISLNDYFAGKIDDIRLYNRALADCDVDSLFNTVDPCIGVTATITPQGNTTFCQGGSVVLDASSGASYLWSPGGATTQSITANSATTYTVTVIDGNGCSATSTGTTVNVNPNPTVTLSSISALCTNAQAITLSGGSPSGGSYTLDGNSATTIQPWLLSAGSHPVVYSYTDGNGCIGTATQSVTINAAPTVTLSGLGTNYLVTDGPVQLTGTPSGGIFTGAGVQGNMFDPSLAGLGTHSIIYMYSNGCMNADGLCTTVDLQIGIEGEDMNGNDGSFSVTPNPNSGSFSVNLNSVNPLGLTTLEIFNSIGQLVQSEQINNQSNTLRKQLELNVAKGLYTVRLTTNGNVYSEKLIVK